MATHYSVRAVNKTTQRATEIVSVIATIEDARRIRKQLVKTLGDARVEILRHRVEVVK